MVAFAKTSVPRNRIESWMNLCGSWFHDDVESLCSAVARRVTHGRMTVAVPLGPYDGCKDLSLVFGDVADESTPDLPLLTQSEHRIGDNWTREMATFDRF